MENSIIDLNSLFGRSKQKVSIVTFRHAMLFLPTPNELFNLFSPGMTEATLFRRLCTIEAIDLNISNSSLKNLFSDRGVSPKTAKQFFSPILEKYPVLSDRLKQVQVEQSTDYEKVDTEPEWSTLLAGEISSSFPQVKSFIADRSLAHRVGMEARNSLSVHSQKGQAYYNAVITKTLLDEAEISGVLRAIEHKDSPQVAIQSAYRLYVDFYMCLFACYDADVMDYLNSIALQHEDAMLNIPENGLIYEFFTRSEGRTVFNGFLMYLKEKFNVKSNNDLCRYIPIKSSELTKEIIDKQDKEDQKFEVQKSTLKEWRSGKTRVSYEKLEKFTSNIIGDEYDCFEVAMYGYVTQALDELFKCDFTRMTDNPELKNYLPDGEITALFKSPQFYKKYFNKMRREYNLR